jgi:DNA (cytosine-5)-methyltransferase 1
MNKLRVLDLFSGIGGFSLGLERTGGFETVAFCEIEEFPRKVLRKHWPKVPVYEDVRTLTADRLAADGIAVDVITGGFPCQDISTAGRQAGLGEGTRSGLWSEIVRLACELRPRFIIVENVANLLAGPSDKPGAWFGRVLGDLAECGYDAEWENIPAAAVGAPHRRERIWIVAHTKVMQQHGCKSVSRIGKSQISEFGNGCGSDIVADADEPRLERRSETLRPEKGWFSYAGHDWAQIGGLWRNTIWDVEPNVGRVAHGVPQRVDRLKALGNAVVPQIPELIGRAILASMKEAA